MPTIIYIPQTISNDGVAISCTDPGDIELAQPWKVEVVGAGGYGVSRFTIDAGTSGQGGGGGGGAAYAWQNNPPLTFPVPCIFVSTGQPGMGCDPNNVGYCQWGSTLGLNQVPVG